VADAQLVERLDCKHDLDKVLSRVILLEHLVGGNPGEEVAPLAVLHHHAEEVVGLKKFLQFHKEVPGVALNPPEQGHLIFDLVGDFLQILETLLVDELEGISLLRNDVIGQLDL